LRKNFDNSRLQSFLNNRHFYLYLKIMTPKFRTLCNILLCTVPHVYRIKVCGAHTHIAHASLMDFHAGAKTARQMLGRAAPSGGGQAYLCSSVGCWHEAQGKTQN
jgi:hypothetical protein